MNDLMTITIDTKHKTVYKVFDHPDVTDEIPLNLYILGRSLEKRIKLSKEYGFRVFVDGVEK